MNNPLPLVPPKELAPTPTAIEDPRKESCNKTAKDRNGTK